MDYAKVTIDDGLTLVVSSAKTGVEVKVALGGIGAQALIDALTEYTGHRGKSANRREATSFGAQDLTPEPHLPSILSRLPAKKRFPIKLNAPLGGVVRLNRK